jgi:hypothetical protein
MCFEFSLCKMLCYVLCCVLNFSHMCDAHLILCFVLVFIMWILAFMFMSCDMFFYVYYVACGQN